MQVALLNYVFERALVSIAQSDSKGQCILDGTR